MQQVKVSLDDSQIEFLRDFRTFGYQDKSSMVREAIDHLRQSQVQRQLEASAELYAEVYAADDDLRTLTEQALEGWPE
jgi:Arc/MetJ-type ribon-helix-helix transcriptional regulator